MSKKRKAASGHRPRRTSTGVRSAARTRLRRHGSARTKNKTTKASGVTRPRRAGASAPATQPIRHDGSGLAPGMQTINTYLAVANIAATMDFLERAFGFSRSVILPDTDGQPRYAEMRHNDSVVMLIRKGDTTAPSGGAAALYTYVDDVDRMLADARAAGAGVEDAEDKPWGDRVAVVTDPDGYRWMLATFKKLVPFLKSD